MKLAALFVVAATGCSAVSAVGSFIKPKPPEITVNNHIEVAAPAAPVQVQAKPSATSAMVGGGVAGAVAGGLAAALVRTTPESIASGALVGAGVGTAIGYAVHSAMD
jgi:predicted lipid-binding transport protein (Tim44 family)